MLIPYSGFAQNSMKDVTVGFSYGFGSELKNNDYSFSNQFFKVEFHHLVKKSKSLKYEFVFEPEINIAEHKLINPFFISNDDPEYQEKWSHYSKGVSISHYILNIGLIVRRPLFKGISSYFLGSAGPMIIDKQSERQAKGFSFSHTLAIGFSAHLNKIIIDIRPGFRHVSNAGLRSPNLGYNTCNLQFGIVFAL